MSDRAQRYLFTCYEIVVAVGSIVLGAVGRWPWLPSAFVALGCSALAWLTFPRGSTGSP